MTSAKKATPSAPSSGSSRAGRHTSTRSRDRSKRGDDHSAPRPMKEATSTAAAAHANSHLGSGRAPTPTSPWAKAGTGAMSDAPRSATMNAASLFMGRSCHRCARLRQGQLRAPAYDKRAAGGSPTDSASPVTIGVVPDRLYFTESDEANALIA